MCCGKTNVIKCERRNKNFTLIEHFSLNLPGKISNLTLESFEDHLKLIYSNETSLYEYFIYQPICVGKTTEINEIVGGKVNINDLFERKTNTKYYFVEKNFPISYN